jgi:hypothetical protein
MQSLETTFGVAMNTLQDLKYVMMITAWVERQVTWASWTLKNILNALLCKWIFRTWTWKVEPQTSHEQVSPLQT